MLQLDHLLKNLNKTIKANIPEILTALGVSGVITTSYLAHQVGQKVARDEDAPAGLSNKEKAQRYWKIYVPVVVSGSLTIVCIVGSTKANGRRTAAAVTAYSLTERAFSEYKEKVVEQLGEGKERKLRDEIVQDQISKNTSKEVVIVGGGQVLCCELYTKRFFRSDMETLRRAENDFNAIIIDQLYVTLEEFYDLIGLPYTSQSYKIGYDSDKLMKLEFTTVLSPDGEPCLAFDYNPAPKPLR